MICCKPLSSRRSLDLVVCSHIQVSFEYLRGGRLHRFSRQPVPLLHHLLSGPWCSPGTLCPSLCPFFLVLALDTTVKSLYVLSASHNIIRRGCRASRTTLPYRVLLTGTCISGVNMVTRKKKSFRSWKKCFSYVAWQFLFAEPLLNTQFIFPVYFLQLVTTIWK